MVSFHTQDVLWNPWEVGDYSLEDLFIHEHLLSAAEHRKVGHM